MPKTKINFADLLDAEKEIRHIDPSEVSLVDLPANLSKFLVVKNQDGGEDTETEETEETTAPEAVAAMVADLKANFGGIASQLGEVMEAVSKAQDVPAVTAPEVPDEQASGEAPTAEAIAALVTAQVTKNLQTAGVLKAPKSPLEQLGAHVQSLEAEIKKAFEAVTTVISGQASMIEDIKKGVVMTDDAETTDAPPAQPGVDDTAPIEVAKSFGNPDSENPEDYPLVSSMLFGGVAANEARN